MLSPNALGPMISLIALVIALLTLLTPGQLAAASAEEAPATQGRLASMGETAPTAGPARGAASEEALLPLLGAWRATVTFPDGSTEATDLEVSRTPGGELSPGTITFGPVEEQFSGPLSAHRDGLGLVFASQAKSLDLSLGTATISGAWSEGELRGTAFLTDEARLVSWTATRITS
ncbi:MAG: hypothetical protein ACI80K_003117 [Paracoccaceae bacterium]|jgi:hypothetical protein